MIFLGMLAGCASSERPTNTAAATSGAAFTATAATALPPASADYRLSPLDTLDISVFQVPDLSQTVQISSTGEITLPLIGAVPAAGRTVAELQKDIAARLGAKYLQSPQVTVFVKDYTSQRYTVDGSVTKPGIYPMSGQTTLIQAIAMAGGLDRVADPSGIVVFRQNGPKKTAAVFNMTQIRAGKADDPQILAGDVIVVDQSGLRAALRGVRESVGVAGLFVPLL